MNDFPSFTTFHEAMHDLPAFPWQARLADQVAESGAWPAGIDLPTGAGKTTVIDIYVWAQAHDAAQRPSGERKMPTRLWYVTPRRSLVDDAHARALHLQMKLMTASDGPLLAVADALRSRHADKQQPPLLAMSFMGGQGRDSASIRQVPVDQSSVLVSTVQMYGSRLLFRGYGESYSLRPVAAALAGSDCVVVCDEAHLTAPLNDLLRQCSQIAAQPQAQQVLVRQRRFPQAVLMTATPPRTNGADDVGSGVDGYFCLDEKDREHPVIARRVHAAKTIRRVPCGTKKADTALVEAALGMIEDSGESSIGIVWANTPRTATSTAAALKRAAKRKRLQLDVDTATGRMRPSDARKIACRIKTRAGVGAERQAGHYVVVATQTLEVGADLDADWMVTEPCSASALTQRLGRLNRLGERAEAECVWTEPGPGEGSVEKFPPYGASPVAVSEALFGCGDGESECDGSPLALRKTLAGIDDASSGPRAPAVTHSMVSAWAKTSLPVAGDQEVEPYIVGVSETWEPPRARVLWRALPEQTDAVGHNSLWPFPAEDEIVELPTSDLLDACRKNGALGERINRVDPDGSLSPLSALADNERQLYVVPPGTYVIPADLGCYNANGGGWDATATQRVEDSSISRGLMLPLALAATLADHELHGSEAESDIRSSVRWLAREPKEHTDNDNDVQLVSLADLRSTRLPQEIWDAAVERELVPVLHFDGWRLLPSRNLCDMGDDDESDLSAVGRTDAPPTLDAHNEEVGARAAAICDALGVDSRLVPSVRTAARQHDIGKADQRFQRLLSVQHDSDVLYAKSPKNSDHRAAARRSGWPSRGARHEEISRRAVIAAYEDGLLPGELDIDLVAHLVVSHHGKGRPMVRTVKDRTGSRQPTLRVPITGGGGVHVANSHELPDFEQADRFARLNALFGPWMLALLETVVRNADWRASGQTRQEERHS